MNQTESQVLNVIDNVKHPLESETYQLKCIKILDKDCVLVLKELIQPNIIQKILKEAKNRENLAYFCVNNHNIYLEFLCISADKFHFLRDVLHYQ